MAGLRPAALESDLVQNHSVPPALAKATAGPVDATMRDSILRLYRSGVTVGSEWEPALSSIRSPGLVFWGVDDKPCPVEYADELAQATGAELLRLQSGHWTPLEKPAALAAALVSHWAL
jgi:pimeloyl-ACP methyl ester carboxylesterase